MVCLRSEAPRLARGGGEGLVAGARPRVCRGRGIGPRLAKQTAAPKQTSPLQSPAVARPPALENAAPAPQKPLLPPQERALRAGGGPRHPLQSAGATWPAPEPQPRGRPVYKKVKRSPQGRPQGPPRLHSPEPRVLPEPSARPRRRLLSTPREAVEKRERVPRGEKKAGWERLRSRPGQSFRNTDCGSNRHALP